MTITVLNSCGHESAIRVSARRIPKIRKERAASGLCRGCWHNQQDRATLATSRSYGLKLLSGSEKQIAWGANIRLTFIHQQLIGVSVWGPTYAQELASLVQGCNEYRRADWWIKNRYYLEERFNVQDPSEPIYQEPDFAF